MARGRTSSPAMQDEDPNLWWAVVVQGVFALIFGILAVVWPGITSVTLAYLFAGYALAFGIVNLVLGFGSISRGGIRWILQLLIGVLGVGVGVYAFRHPAITLASLILLIGISFIVQGVIDLVLTVFGDFTSFASRVFTGIVGFLGIIAGGAILREPVTGGLVFVWLIGLYAIVLGVAAMVRGFELRKFAD